MASRGAASITIPVTVAMRAQAESMKAMRKQLEDNFKDANLGPALEKSFSRTMERLGSKVTDFETILGKGMLGTSDLKGLERIANQYNQVIGQFHSKVGESPLAALGFDPKTMPQLEQFTRQIEQLQRAEQQYRSQTSNQVLKSRGQDEIAKRMQGLGISGEQSVGKTELALTGRLEAENQQLQSLIQQREALVANKQAADQEWAAQQEKFQQIRRKAIDANESEAFRQAYGKNHIRGDLSTISAQQQTKVASGFANAFTAEIRNAFANGIDFDFADDSISRKLLEAILPPEQLQQYLSGQLSGLALLDAVPQKLNGTQARNVLNIANQHIGRVQQAGGANAAIDTANNYRAAQLIYQQAQTAHQEQISEYTNLDAQVENKQSLIKDLNTVASAISAAAEAMRAVAQDKFGGPRSELEAQRRAASRQMAQEYANQNVPSGYISTAPMAGGMDSIEEQAEVNAFKSKMSGALKQWMGTREIVGYVKRGIREAYADIQSLDKAMTNIAVVTNMSTQDLWGKIDQYMATAKQYGVTTQGVYEVSQLYYQQGLGESDVMAATTETLKMARQQPIYK